MCYYQIALKAAVSFAWVESAAAAASEATSDIYRMLASDWREGSRSPVPQTANGLCFIYMNYDGQKTKSLSR